MTLPLHPTADSLAKAQRLMSLNTVIRESDLALVQYLADHLRNLGAPQRVIYDDKRREANPLSTLGKVKPVGLVLWAMLSRPDPDVGFMRDQARVHDDESAHGNYANALAKLQ